jgi:queuine tRNA-ribosyltransferase
MLHPMFEFRILKRSKKSRARLGVITTPHGEIETPSFVPVATRGSVRTLDSDEAAAMGSQLLICNTFHLHLTPGEKLVKKAGGLHEFMHWKKPLMTDSGGFQVFSLGFGSDHGMSKMLKQKKRATIGTGAQPKKLTILEDGVRFRSPIDGAEIFLGPKESIRIQEALGADIMFAFDECPSPIAGKKYLLESLERTHRWAQLCLESKKTDQALYGIVQGGAHETLRVESARTIGGMGFDGFGFGGEFGYDKRAMKRILGAVSDALPEEKPRHILGVGHPEDFPVIAQGGGDTFDCIAPTHYGRRGILFTSRGRINIAQRRFLADQKPIDALCRCDVCANYSRAYVSHLVRANELTGLKLATMHNLHFFNEYAKTIRKKIGNGEL